jgi:hypothetical protein
MGVWEKDCETSNDLRRRDFGGNSGHCTTIGAAHIRRHGINADATSHVNASGDTDSCGDPDSCRLANSGIDAWRNPDSCRLTNAVVRHARG